MAKFSEVGSILVNGTSDYDFEDSIEQEYQVDSTYIMYGIALTDSVDGRVTVKIADSVYSLDDEEDMEEEEVLEVNLEEDTGIEEIEDDDATDIVDVNDTEVEIVS